MRAKVRSTGRPSLSRRLHRDEGGQISFLAVFGAVAFVSLLGLVMTTGDQVTVKMRMQDTVDAAALSGGAWIARGLNITSAFNVVQTQLVGGAILLNALASTLEWAQPIVQLQNKAYLACMGTLLGAAICAIPYAITTAQLFVLRGLVPLVRNLANKLSRCDDGAFWVVAKALEWVNRAVKASFFVLALAETESVAAANGASVAVLVPGPVFHGDVGLDSFTLPTRRVPFSAHCDPMQRGSPATRERGYHLLLGYSVNKGPYRLGRERLAVISSLVTGFPPVGWALLPFLAEAQKRTLCTGEDWSPIEFDIETVADSIEECQALGGEAQWTRTVIRSRPFDEPLPDPDGFFDSKMPPPPEGASEEEIRERMEALQRDPDIASVSTSSRWESCDWRPPDGERQLSSREILVSEEPPNVDYEYTLVVWTLGETKVEKEQQFDKDPAGGQCRLKPQPYLLDDDDDALRYLAIAYRPNRRIFFRRPESPPSRSGEAGERGLWARPLVDPPALFTYAQIEVYNGISNDTYTQDWRVRLDHASLIEQPFAGVGEAFSGVIDFVGRLGGSSPKDEFWKFNNH